MKIFKHRLRNDDNTSIPFVKSPNIGGIIKPLYLIMHYTAGRNAESSIKTLTTKKAKGNASAHLVIARSGEITQLVPFDRRAWHAGRSHYQGLTQLNGHSIGIEMDNAGKLHRSGSHWVSWFGAQYQPSEVIEAVHKNESTVCGWHAYTPEQIEAAMAVACVLHGKYGFRDVLGHDDIAPERKVDPGPAFPMDSFRSRVLGREDDEETEVRYQTTTALNIRTGPGTNYEKLPHSPLPEGTIVEVQAYQGNWRQVSILDVIKGDNDVEGWVHGKYLVPD
jgi:N-acetylmuramoyl-L-alanine amidase